MWNWIRSDENYLNKYHDVLSEVVSIIDSGEFKKESDKMYDLIRPYLEKDPKAFYNTDRSRKAYETVLDFTEMRAESVKKQVNGQLAVRSEMQAKEDRVDASEITLPDMGSMHEVLESGK